MSSIGTKALPANPNFYLSSTELAERSDYNKTRRLLSEEDEILIHILSFSTCEDLSSFAQTCKLASDRVRTLAPYALKTQLRPLITSMIKNLTQARDSRLHQLEALRLSPDTDMSYLLAKEECCFMTSHAIETLKPYTFFPENDGVDKLTPLTTTREIIELTEPVLISALPYASQKMHKRLASHLPTSRLRETNELERKIRDRYLDDSQPVPEHQEFVLDCIREHCSLQNFERARRLTRHIQNHEIGFQLLTRIDENSSRDMNSFKLTLLFYNTITDVPLDLIYHHLYYHYPKGIGKDQVGDLFTAAELINHVAVKDHFFLSVVLQEQELHDLQSLRASIQLINSINDPVKRELTAMHCATSFSFVKLTPDEFCQQINIITSLNALRAKDILLDNVCSNRLLSDGTMQDDQAIIKPMEPHLKAQIVQSLQIAADHIQDQTIKQRVLDKKQIYERTSKFNIKQAFLPLTLGLGTLALGGFIASLYLASQTREDHE